MRRHRVLAAAFLAALPSLAPAQSNIPGYDPLQPPKPPTTASGFSFGGGIDTEFNLDRYGKRGQRPAYTDLYNKTDLGLYLGMPGGFTLNFVGKFEPADRDPDGTNQYFANEAAWIDQLYLSWVRGPVEIFAGKIEPRFGFAWDIAPGLYGTDFGEEYEITEKIGAGISLSWSDLLGATGRIGSHSVIAQFYQADRTGLSGSLGAARWLDPDATSASGQNIYRRRNRRQFGGPDNTQGYGNFLLSLAGERVPGPVGTIQYTLGYGQRRAGADSVAAGTQATENGYVAGVAWEIPLPLRISATPIVELVRLDNADGIDNQRREYVTAGVSLTRKPFTLAYVYATQRDSDRVAGGDSFRTQNMASLTLDIGYYIPLGFLNGMEATIGWRNLREGGVSANDYGAQLAWGYKF
jgi:hypothetical protein